MLADFASVNWHESCSAELADALMQLGVGVEAGLNVEPIGRVVVARVARPPALPSGAPRGGRRSSATGGRGRSGAARYRARPDLDDVPVLLHGEGASAWPVLEEAVRRGFDNRVGLEDILALPDGTPAEGNADLVRTARAMIAGAVSR